jgi:acyl carrier protein
MRATAEPEGVRPLLEEVLGVDLGDESDPSRATIDRWDSLAHLEVVFVLEEEFGVRFSEPEIAEMSSLDAIVRVIRGKHAS